MDGVKRKLIKFGFVNECHFTLIENGICPLCFSTLTSDDGEFEDNEEESEN